jgi:outer membrane receptor protein involved in Fe transport
LRRGAGRTSIAALVTRAWAIWSLVWALSAAAGDARFLHTPPAEAHPGEALVIEGSLAAEGSMRQVELQVRAPGGSWAPVPLELQYGDLYRGVIPPGQVSAQGVEYFVQGVRDSGEAVVLLGSATKPMKVPVPGAPPPAVEKKPEPAAKAPPPCVKKKGRKCPEEPKPEPEEPVAPVKPVEAPVKPARTAEPPPARVEPVKREPPPEEPARPARVEPPRRHSELEDELAIYAAEDTGGLVQHLEASARQRATVAAVLTRAQLQQLGVRYVPEALQLLPGVTVTRDVQGAWRVGVRGLRNDAEVQVTLNGLPLNNFYDGRALLSLPIDSLERIEFFTGPGAVEAGPGGFLAVVNLVSDRSDGLRGGASAGLYQSFDGHLSAAQHFGAVQVFGDADVASQAGQSRTVLKDAWDTTTVTRDKRTSDKRLLINAGLGLALNLEEAGTFSAEARFLYEKRSALLGLFDTVGPHSQLGWQGLSAQLGWSKPVPDGGKLTARLWFDQQDTDRLFQLSPDGYAVRAGVNATIFDQGLQEERLIGARTIGGAFQAQLPLPAKNLLTAGLDARLQSLSNDVALANYDSSNDTPLGALQPTTTLTLPSSDGKGGRGPAADRLGLGVFVSDVWSPIEPFSLEAGLRVELTQLPTAAADGTWTGQTFVPALEPRLGVAFAPVKALVFRATYARAYRAPTVQELADPVANTDFNQGRSIGNPLLTGSTIDAVEVGFQSVQALGEAKVRLKGQAFFDHLTTPIVGVDPTGNLAPYSNRLAGVQVLGAEGEARLEIAPRASVWLNVSFFRAEDLGLPAQSRLLTDLPQARLNAGFSLPLGPWLAFDVTARWSSERRSDSRTVLELVRRYVLPASTVVGAQLRSELLFDHLQLAVMGQNVFNVDTFDDVPRPDRLTAGLPREGLSIFGSVKVVF